MSAAAASCAYANELQTFPRHLGIHSGGMVICDRPVIEVCPVEWARMENRTVLQWDKDDCAAVGLVKFDLLGLGMLSALQYAFEMLKEVSRDDSQSLLHHELDLAKMPLDDPEVYDMLCRADSVGVFQVESRAQMATLPRLKPRKFYDLVVEVALIRPGPIQGGSVHPYIRRKNGLEETTIPHPLLENALAKTLGVPLFQEQLMQMAIDVAGFDASEADQLRRAMGSKRSAERMRRIRDRLYAGMAANGITGELADDIFVKLAAFANYGFPESHAMSFAYLVYASSWLKRYYPAAFCAALLNAQPMGFYSTQSLVDDARRHGVTVLRPDINASNAMATLERPTGTRESAVQGRAAARLGARRPAGPARAVGSAYPSGRGGRADRSGTGSRRPVPRHGATWPGAPALTTTPPGGAGHRGRVRLLRPQPAGGAVGGRRRGAGAERPAARHDHRAATRRCCPAWTRWTRWSPTCGRPGCPRTAIRCSSSGPALDRVGALSDRAGRVPVEHGRRVLVGGIVTHRQRPATAGGITFLNLEDETGMLNVVCSPGLWKRYRKVAQTSAALLIRGRVERYDGVVNLNAERLTPIKMPIRQASRDFR